jgi:putative transposase
MTEYRHFHLPGATWFFTVNLAERLDNRLLVEHIDVLRATFARVKNKHPFNNIDAIVVLPEDLHCVLTLPAGDGDFSTLRELIKSNFSRNIVSGERISKSRKIRSERGLWQRRFWEHLIRDETDYWQHVDYIHWNPVKHGWVRYVKDWPHSSFHRYVKQGIYSENWGTDFDGSVFGARE